MIGPPSRQIRASRRDDSGPDDAAIHAARRDRDDMVATLSPLDACVSDMEALCARLLDSTAEGLRRRARASLGAAQRARAGQEGPAVLRLRMLELAHALKLGAIDAEARAEAAIVVAGLREAVLNRPSLSFADAEARLRTLDR